MAELSGSPCVTAVSVRLLFLEPFFAGVAETATRKWWRSGECKFSTSWYFGLVSESGRMSRQ